jgi:hypothetical protein
MHVFFMAWTIVNAHHSTLFVAGLLFLLRFAVVTGGGLTVIANAPNPAGQALLKDSYMNGISPLGLLKGSLGPTLIMFVIFMVNR